MGRIGKNFAYNLVLTMCNYIFPLIVYPYVSRVLGVANIGICGFVDGIINYFVLFSQLGIGSFGVREVARCKDDDERSRLFSNLFTMNLMTVALAVSVLIGVSFLVPSLEAYRPFLMIGIIKIVAPLFLVEWFFQGMERFRYITIRSVIVRSLYVIAVFVFVHKQEDVRIYYLLTGLVVALNAVFNWNYSRKFRKLSFRDLTPAVYLMPVLVYGYYRILTSMYTTFNVVFLGFVSDDVQVGYFTTATKLYAIIMAAFTAFTTVMVPRVSSMLSKGENRELQEIIDKVVSLLVALVVPIIIFCILNAGLIIRTVSGSGYEGAEIPFRIVIGLLLIIGLEQIVIQQCLMASGNTKLIFYVSSLGAVVGVGLNILLTPHLKSIGSAVCWGISELSVLILGLYLLRKYMDIRISWKKIVHQFLYAFLYLGPMLPVFLKTDNPWIVFGITAVYMTGLFVMINFWWHKNSLLTEWTGRIFKGKKA